MVEIFEVLIRADPGTHGTARVSFPLASETINLPDIETEESTADGAEGGEDCSVSMRDRRSEPDGHTVNIRDPIHGGSSHNSADRRRKTVQGEIQRPTLYTTNALRDRMARLGSRGRSAHPDSGVVQDTQGVRPAAQLERARIGLVGMWRSGETWRNGEVNKSRTLGEERQCVMSGEACIVRSSRLIWDGDFPSSGSVGY